MDEASQAFGEREPRRASRDSRDTDPNAPLASQQTIESAQEQFTLLAEEAKRQAGDLAQDVKGQAGEFIDQMKTQASDFASEAKQQAADLIGDVRDQAAGLVDPMKEKAREIAEQQKAAGAERIGGFADAVHDAADQLERQIPGTGGLIHGAAEQLERVSAAMRDTSIDEAIESVGSFARKQPAVFFAGSLVAGFVLSRIFINTAGRRSGGGMTPGA